MIFWKVNFGRSKKDVFQKLEKGRYYEIFDFFDHLTTTKKPSTF